MAKIGSKLTDMDDVDLVAEAVKGKQAAFLLLYDRYKHGVFVHVNGIVPQKEETEDIVIESFQKAFAQIKTYNQEYRFSTWLYKIARNTAIDHLDKLGREGSKMQIDSIDEEKSNFNDIVATSPDPEENVIRSQEYGKLVDAINGLSDLYRKAAQMVLLESYGYQEVAEALDLPLGTVKTRVKRAKEYILRMMEESDNEI